MYPVTLTLSLAAISVIGTVSDAKVAGRLKLLSVGAVTSGRVMLTVADFPADTLPAASLAQA
jgi:hypothetical protein